MQGDFIIDFVSTFPFELVVPEDSIFTYTPVLKLVRVFRLVKIIKFMRVIEDVKLSLKLMLLVFYLGLYLHFIACVWWLIVKDAKTWFHPNEAGLGNMYHVYDMDVAGQYSFCLYATVQMLLIADIYPRGST